MDTCQAYAGERKYAFTRSFKERRLLVPLLLYFACLVSSVAAVHDVNQTTAPPKDLTIPPGTEYDRESLQKLTEFRQRHRKTVDGMLCAAAFVRNGNTFTDCTTTEAPDGSVGREWCYVEVQLIGVGFRDWDFCAGTVDYDVLRSKAALLSQLKASELAHSVLQLSATEKRLEKTLTHFDAVCGHGTESHENEMNSLSHTLRGLERALQQVEANSQTLHTLREEYEALAEQLEITRKSALNDKRNCSIVQGYFPAMVGDGVRASYFDNPYLRGPPVGFVDHPSLSLTFDEILPVSGLDIRSFSVRFETYLRVPVSGNYTFWLEADCNFLMFVDGELVIEHGLEGRGRFVSGFNTVGVVALDGRSTSSTHTSSRKMSLVGGKRYPLVLEYSHQSALKYRDENVVRLSLSWETDTHSRTVIGSEYFFRRRDSGESLVISGLEAKLFDLAMLENGAQAFLNVTNLLVADVPDRFRGSRMVRTVVKPDYDQVNFYISHDAFVYVAQSIHSPYIPISEDMTMFERSGDVLSVYGFNHNCEEANNQQEFSVYYKRFKAGPVKLQMLPETSFFIFLQPTLANSVCPDDVQYLPFKNGDGCASSSSLSATFDCSKGFGSGYWQSGAGRTSGQWLMRTFANPVELVHFHFSPMDGNAPTRARIAFPDGVEEEFELQSQLRFELGYHGVVDSIRIAFDSPTSGEPDTSSDKNGTSDTIGGTFAFYGRECGAHTVMEDAVRFPLHINFCQGGQSCGSNQLDLGHVKGSHGRLSYGWGSSNVVAGLDDVPFCTARMEHTTASDSISLHGEEHDITEGLVPANKESTFALLLKNKAGLPLGLGQRWTIDVPEHGIYKVEVLLSALCSTVESASLLMNGVEMLEGELLQVGQSLEFCFAVAYYPQRASAMEDKLKSLVFHHYVPKDENLKRLVRSNLEDYRQIEEDIDAAITKVIDEHDKKDVLSLVLPSKQNWDLKRDLRDSRQLLATRTDAVIMKLLQKNSNKEEIDSAMLVHFNQDNIDRELEQDDY
ncbi:PA14 domain-containing protein [Babesia ovis]|uniref:PA14 domain-containing protein n=1 Tax=Babesia ovis TaxID=5869 RepID=A0A9W5WW89_BABOV|nr:PA14 domain-containing protein [Babesia ovis]